MGAAPLRRMSRLKDRYRADKWVKYNMIEDARRRVYFPLVRIYAENARRRAASVFASAALHTTKGIAQADPVYRSNIRNAGVTHGFVRNKHRGRT